MSRLDCLDGTQRFLIEAALAYCSSVGELVKICQVHPRTLRDWHQERHRMSFEVFQRLAERIGMRYPKPLSVLPEFWHIQKAASLGGQKRYQLYGAPGSQESRQRGGRASARKFCEDPAFAKIVGFRLRKPIRQPRKSALLAEFVGILLGDGCLGSPFQVSIAFNSETDASYGVYLQQLFRRLFGVTASIKCRAGTRGGNVVASSRALVEYLETVGLRRGNKVRHQVDVPQWIWTQRSYRRACLRGLMDTDGSVYRYTHHVNGHLYGHVALCFTNRSQPLLVSAARLLRGDDFHPRIKQYQVCLNRQMEIERYFDVIGSSNSKHLARFQQYFKSHTSLGEVRESG